MAALVCGCPSSAGPLFLMLAGVGLLALSAITLYRVRPGGNRIPLLVGYVEKALLDRAEQLERLRAGIIAGVFRIP